jgi:hypothetical protein
MASKQPLQGNRPLRFGRYEIRKTFDWKTVLIALGPILLTVLLPWLESLDTGTGTMIAVAAAIGVVIRAIIEWLEDNSLYRIPSENI